MSRDFVNASSQWASTTTVPLSAVPFSWAVWFKPNSTTTNRELMWLGNSGSSTNYWTMGVTTSAIRNSARNSTESPANTTAGPTANVWNHACGTFGSNSSRAAYLDGGNKGTNATSQTPSGINRFAIASLARSTPTNFFDGQIAHVAVWNVELTDDEAAMLGQHRVSPLFVRPSALVWYSPYVGRDSVEIDIIGGGSLTLTNSPASSAEEPPLLWLPGRKRIFLPSSVQQYLQSVSGAIAPSASLVKLTSRTLLGGLASVGALTKRAQKPLSGTLSSAGVLSAVKTALLSLVGTLTSSGGVVRQTRKPMTGSLSTAGALTRRTLRATVGAIAASGSLTKRINRALAGAIASSATLAAVKTALISLAGSLTPSGALRRSAQKPLTGSISSAGVLQRATSKLFAGNVASAGALSKQILRTLSGALSFVGAVAGAKLGEVITAAERIVHVRSVGRTVWLERLGRVVSLRTKNRNVEL